MVMGHNFYTEISDVLTDAFDMIEKEWNKETKLTGSVKSKRAKQVHLIVQLARGAADEAFRTNYKNTRRLVNSLK